MKKLAILASFLTSAVLTGQGVVGVGNFIHVVANLDQSIEFYRDGLGLEMTGAPGPRVFSANAVVSSLYDAPGAQSRVASFKLPESNMAVEIVEFQGLNAAPVKPRFFDPGAITLILPVQDLEAVKTRLSRIKGLEWISASGNFSAVVRDPDGIFVDLEQPRPLSPGPPQTVGLRVTVEGFEKTMGFYRNALGFTSGADGFAATRSRLLVPGDSFPVDFVNPGYVDRKAVRSAIHDPGSGVLRLRVVDFDAVVKALTTAGATVVSTGGRPVNLGRNRAVILRDRDNLFVQVLESVPAAAKSPAVK